MFLQRLPRRARAMLTTFTRNQPARVSVRFVNAEYRVLTYGG